MSAAPTRRSISQALPAVALIAAVVWLSFESGGYFDQPRTTLAVVAWLAVAGLALVRPVLLLAPTRAGQVAIAALVGLAAWTALSELWAPLAEAARQDSVRVVLYAAVLPLAQAAFRTRASLRLLEAALFLVAAVVIGYGLLGELGVLDLERSLRAAGRLEQPLSYWNATAAMAALGLVLAARVAIDRSRPAALRLVAGVSLPPLGAGLYLTYSRGGIAAALVGLLALALLAPEAKRLWTRLGPRGRPAVATLAVVVLAVGLTTVVLDRESTPARGATAERFADAGSTRGDYWRVALSSFGSQPLHGVGTAGFGVEWLREREVREGAVDAHSLYLETAAELGLVGIALLLALVAGIVGSAAAAWRGDAEATAGPAAALLALAFHCAVDWDWEMPALAVSMLLLAGALIARAATERGQA